MLLKWLNLMLLLLIILMLFLLVIDLKFGCIVFCFSDCFFFIIFFINCVIRFLVNWFFGSWVMMVLWMRWFLVLLVGMLVGMDVVIGDDLLYLVMVKFSRFVILWVFGVIMLVCRIMDIVCLLCVCVLWILFVVMSFFICFFLFGERC